MIFWPKSRERRYWLLSDHLWRYNLYYALIKQKTFTDGRFLFVPWNSQSCDLGLVAFRLKIAFQEIDTSWNSTLRTDLFWILLGVGLLRNFLRPKNLQESCFFDFYGIFRHFQAGGMDKIDSKHVPVLILDWKWIIYRWRWILKKITALTNS